MSDLTMTLDVELVKLSNLETVNFILESKAQLKLSHVDLITEHDAEVAQYVPHRERRQYVLERERERERAVEERTHPPQRERYRERESASMYQQERGREERTCLEGEGLALTLERIAGLRREARWGIAGFGDGADQIQFFRIWKQDRELQAGREGGDERETERMSTEARELESRVLLERTVQIGRQLGNMDSQIHPKVNITEQKSKSTRYAVEGSDLM